MRTVLELAFRSLWNRRTTAALTVFSIAVSVALLLGVQQVRVEAREGFADTISGTDLIVGARSGPINLLLYSVFRVGDATAEVSWTTYRKIAAHPDVAWTISISLGDSHRGFRVMGTDGGYFDHYRFGRKRVLTFSAGGPFQDLYDAVLGADVAATLGYKLGDSIVISHGVGEVSFVQHADKPFRVAGILERTGTPVDRTVHVSLEAISALHVDWQSGAQAAPGARVSPEDARGRDLTPDGVTAFLVSMKSKSKLLLMQRALNDYSEEPLTAIIPGAALQQLWSLVGVADKALLIVASFVLLAGLLGMITAILTSLNERRREMAILRSVGARAGHVFALLMLESGLLALAGIVVGLAFDYTGLLVARPVVAKAFGVFLEVGPPSAEAGMILVGIALAALLAGAISAWRAYRNSLADGLTIRV